METIKANTRRGQSFLERYKQLYRCYRHSTEKTWITEDGNGPRVETAYKSIIVK